MTTKPDNPPAFPSEGIMKYEQKAAELVHDLHKTFGAIIVKDRLFTQSQIEKALQEAHAAVCAVAYLKG